MSSIKEPRVVTFGCRLNTYESEVMRDHARNAGLDDAIIINTCAVTTEAERQARQSIRRLRRENPDSKIFVTGCAVQVNPDKFAKMDEIDRIFGNDAKMKAETFLMPDHERVVVNDIMSVEETASHLVSGFEGRARAFVQVQNGCDHRCTFCIIPFGRGNSRSVPMGEIVSQVRELVANGYGEVVLTGVDITSYGHDLPGKPTLGQMSRRLLAQVPELPRLRISSIDPVEVDEDLFRLIETEPRLMPHMHISLQAGDDMVLKRMKRRHLRQDVVDFCEKVRALRSDVTFGADIIAGFPTETDEMAENTLRLVDECGLIYLHVFPYSSRPGTPAAKMPQVRKDIRKDRAAALRAAGDIQLNTFLKSRIGMIENVLVEKENTGHTEHFAPVMLDRVIEAGTIAKAKVTGLEDGKLIAELTG
ncbi:MAG: tRNA (N(6)-L-threonylcarbamoyladenosine(37)-C(2))-methylthiotransferase MtaB [Thalassospira sp.]|uniref:tRNA (N(6)-L-threonylcarbamoyladenosine(37)-C(2))- methylthiotransferase MtaB n=1 Tax=Thalassospira sp. GB04J01 TaxID=1485225 RepID=UPI000C0F8AFF|nr:tRNA (N(6)-L-threonylcarbamoyladenosine(37)-C(2))-methylthiotransferase MtaB [Thalassospira sp. GB04J01]MBV17165.1 tRNA (N(6)-L-threonylcarbamoyladenosine(37)-C(2))-methylthiotransferase MtaB [Thalassospira sp.]